MHIGVTSSTFKAESNKLSIARSCTLAQREWSCIFRNDSKRSMPAHLPKMHLESACGRFPEGGCPVGCVTPLFQVRMDRQRKNWGSPWFTNLPRQGTMHIISPMVLVNSWWYPCVPTSYLGTWLQYVTICQVYISRIWWLQWPHSCSLLHHILIFSPNAMALWLPNTEVFFIQGPSAHHRPEASEEKQGSHPARPLEHVHSPSTFQ